MRTGLRCHEQAAPVDFSHHHVPSSSKIILHGIMLDFVTSQKAVGSPETSWVSITHWYTRLISPRGPHDLCARVQTLGWFPEG